MLDELGIFMPGVFSEVDRTTDVRRSLKLLRDDAEIVTNILTQVDRAYQVLQSLCLLGNLEEKIHKNCL